MAVLPLIRRLGMALAFAAPGLLAAADLPATFLKVSNCEFRDQGGAGKRLPLRGVNLGGWLMIEPWMCPMNPENPGNPWPIPNDLRESGVQDVLVSRFGVAAKDALVDGYRDAWITATDLQLVADLGMNLVRVPFSYRLFQEPQDPAVPLAQVVWKPDAVAFKHLDWVVQQAAAKGLYVLLDLHEVEGLNAQGTPAVSNDPRSFWYNAAYQERTRALWVKIAQRYAGNPTVIGYDLLNEPWGRPVGTYDGWISAIRAVDPDHTIFTETWAYDSMPTPATSAYRWSNVACSLHWYPGEATVPATRDGFLGLLAAARSAGSAGAGAALHIGEFHLFMDWPDAATMSPADYQAAVAATSARQRECYRASLAAFETQGVAWTKWTLKSVNQGGWSLYSRRWKTPAPTYVDPTTASQTQIQAAWASWQTPTNTQVDAEAAVLLAGPVAVADGAATSNAGTWRFTPRDLLANDRCLSSAATLSVDALPARTAHGSITAQADGYLYQADPGFSGIDTFAYRLVDTRTGQAALVPGTVSLTVTSTPVVDPGTTSTTPSSNGGGGGGCGIGGGLAGLILAVAGRRRRR